MDNKSLSKVIIFLTLLSSCTEKSEEDNGLFQLLRSEETGIEFSNELYESSELNIITYEYFFNGSGIGVGDINNDGLQDIYFSGNMTNGKLYLNKGDFKFEDITESAGINTQLKWGTGVNMVDINADGWMDLYLCFSGPYHANNRRNQLYINNKDNTFTERAAEYGLDNTGYQTSAGFFDYDKDGDLDVYLLNNTTDEMGPNVLRPKRINGEMKNTDQLMRNDNGYFRDVSIDAGINIEGYGLGLAIGDIDGDGWEDIYVSNDYVSNDILYINNGDGSFTDKAADYLKHSSYSSMGCDLADYNNDGRPDIIAVDMLPPDHRRRKSMINSINYNRYASEIKLGYQPQVVKNTIQLNRGLDDKDEVVYSEISNLSGVSSTDWSWSPLFFDIDNDGFKDLTITNGYPRDNIDLDFIHYKSGLVVGGQFDNNSQSQLIQYISQLKGVYLPNYSFRNNGDLRFTDSSADWGFVDSSFSSGSAYVDLDNDGDLDYITCNSFDKVFVYKNTSRQRLNNHYIKVKLRGTDENINGIGSKVYVYGESIFQYQHNYPYRGYQSSVDPILHFGLGNIDKIDSIVVIWPDFNRQVIEHPNVDQCITLSYEKSSIEIPTKKQYNTPLEKVTQTKPFIHKDIEFADFNIHPLIPHKYSIQGPKISIGDVNADGLDDYFIGGGYNQSGQIFVQMPSGQFKSQEIDQQEDGYEDLGSVFFDADGDGDLDLYVTSGSNEFEKDHHLYQDRLYLNDGQGNFQMTTNWLPPMKTSTSSVASGDFDGDGDLDLCIGGYVDMQSYPLPAPSYILENKGGYFEDVTDSLYPKLRKIGMIKDIQCTDIDNNGHIDIILAGEWTPIIILTNDNGQFRDGTTKFNMEDSRAWWNTILPVDIDGDGDIDLVAGNQGLNSSFTTSVDKPLTMFVDDFDGNNSIDPIIVQYRGDHRAPVAFRNDLLAWISPLKKRYRNYKSYAEASWSEIFPNRNKGLEFQVDDFRTQWYENIGNETFKPHILPMEVQFGPVHGITTTDVNGDGYMDLILVGNSEAPDSHQGPLDGLNGLILTGNRDKSFDVLPMDESGFHCPADNRDIGIVKNKNGLTLIVSANNAETMQFTVK
ncbi:CRTAC1 family protein [Membranihabitans marinus]|uniref:CRTAC1 family protein n=1 Tax=Membranihabitans marinus TaxID=1227546 RepID=UPI001F341DDD|nr:CRTAC1 family protein [Membranihabitans marinus]